jgi:hypothetical protein
MAIYPNKGKLSVNSYKTKDNQPDHKGEIVMSRSTLKELMAEHDGDEIVIKLSGYNADGQYGPWIKLSWNNYKPADESAPRKPVHQAPLDDSDIPF